MPNNFLPDPELRPFHEHLSKCDWCNRHPFDLCDEGSRLLAREADQARGMGANTLATNIKGGVGYD
jgi:hypothetical protein